jgi:hypothetical protein
VLLVLLVLQAAQHSPLPLLVCGHGQAVAAAAAAASAAAKGAAEAVLVLILLLVLTLVQSPLPADQQLLAWLADPLLAAHAGLGSLVLPAA